MDMMLWENLLSEQRIGSDTADSTRTKDDDRSFFEQDYGRILYSSAFRRLQDKTQVFPLGRNDYVRTRLTHSLEVANIGQSLGYRAGKWICPDLPESMSHLSPANIGSIVASACLAHDLGNPPFGHSGEKAIEDALKNHGYPDISFEGNAQGFRLLTRIADPMEGKGLKLTAAVLGAFMKYPCTEAYYKEAKKGDSGQIKRSIECKKFCITSAEYDAAEKVAKMTGLIPKTGTLEGINDSRTQCWSRHPLAFLMEAADDISYLIADMEDAYFCRLVTYEKVKEHLLPLIQEDKRPAVEEKLKKILAGDLGQSDNSQQKQSAVNYLRAVAIGSCIDSVSDAFRDKSRDILSGTFQNSLMQVIPESEAYNRLRAFSCENIYNAPQVINTELTGFQVIDALMDVCMCYVKDPTSLKGSKTARYIHAPEALAEKEEEQRLQHVLDYISGMTDSFALETYQRLYGISSFGS